MNELRLEDVAMIFGGLALFLVCLALVAYGRLYGPAIVKAFKARQPLVGIRYVEPEDAPASSAGGMQQPVPADTYQPVSGGTGAPDTSMVPADALALARHLAELRQPNGLHWLSANKIAGVVPASRNEVLAAVREVRGAPDEDEAPAPAGPVFIQSGVASWRRVAEDGRVL